MMAKQCNAETQQKLVNYIHQGGKLILAGRMRDEFFAELTLRGYRCDQSITIEKSGEAQHVRLHGTQGVIVLRRSKYPEGVSNPLPTIRKSVLSDGLWLEGPWSPSRGNIEITHGHNYPMFLLIIDQGNDVILQRLPIQ